MILTRFSIKILANRLKRTGNKVLKYFSQISTLHGTVHLSERFGRSLDRILWAVIMWCAVFGAIYSCIYYLIKYMNSPLVISLERDYVNWNTTFPAFTICSQRKMNETALKLYLKELNLPDDRVEKVEQFLELLVSATMDNVTDLYDITEFKPSQYLGIIERLTNNYNRQYNIEFEASAPKFKFSRIITELGVCDTFNSRISPFFSPEYILNDRLPSEKPSFELNYLDTHKYVIVKDLAKSYVYIHGPYDLPQYVQRHDLDESDGYSARKHFIMSATTILAKADVRNLFIFLRKCRYFDETNLLRFPVYTYDLCKLECKINEWAKKIGCVPYFYKALPHERVCGAYEMLYQTDVTGVLIEDSMGECHCQELCTDVRFNLYELNSLYWINNITFQLELLLPKSRVKREVRITFADITVAWGAAHSFFLGSSVLTFVEYFYLLFGRSLIRRIGRFMSRLLAVD